jgi:hypothetical protein
MGISKSPNSAGKTLAGSRNRTINTEGGQSDLKQRNPTLLKPTDYNNTHNNNRIEEPDSDDLEDFGPEPGKLGGPAQQYNFYKLQYKLKKAAQMQSAAQPDFE